MEILWLAGDGVYTADDVHVGRGRVDRGFTYFAEVAIVPAALSMGSNVKQSWEEMLCSSLASRLDALARSNWLMWKFFIHGEVQGGQ